MFGWLRVSTPPSEESSRRAELLKRVLWSMTGLVPLGVASASLEEKNDVRLTFVFYGSVLLGLAFVAGIVRLGRELLAAVLLSWFFWLLVAFVTVKFGGLTGQWATVFTVCVLLIGGLVSGRAALGMAVISSAWCGLIAYLEVHHALPRPITPYSPINAWGAVTVTLLLTSLLLRASIASMERMHARAEKSALERDEALRRSIRSQKMELVGNLTSGIAHDFNNLLTVIGSASHMLRDELPRLDAEARAWLDDLDGATFRATLMTRQLLSIGRAPAGDRTPVNVSSLVRELARMLPRLLGSTIEIEVEVTDRAVVLASRAGLEQILLNLAVNARDAMPEGGRLSLRVLATAEEVIIQAKDSGIGMDEATQARVFEPFFTTKTMGTGLGLATVRQLVNSFDGVIRVTSLPHEGASFEVRFPASDRPLELALDLSADPVAGPSSIRSRLLLVEDDALVRRGLCRWLGHEGFEVIPVADGEEAWALVGSLRGLRCVVSDLSMPRMDGEQLAEKLAAAFPELPVVLMSGNREPPIEILSAKRVFVAKPVDHTQLLSAIAEVMRAN